MSSPSDFFRTARVYDPSTGQLDYTALAYTDGSSVHLELLNESGVQIGTDFVVPGITSFDRLNLFESPSSLSHSTRIEIDYTASNPSGGTEIKGFIYDTATSALTETLSAGGLKAGTPFNDSFTWGAGVYTIDGGGGSDTLIATGLSTTTASLSIDGLGEAVLADGSGDSDTLRRFTTIVLSDATVTISGNSLTEAFSNGTKIVKTYTHGELFSTANYNSSNQLTSITYPSQIPDNFTGRDRSDILFISETGVPATSNALATWQLNDTTIVGGGTIGNPGPAWTYQGTGQFYGRGASDILFRNQNGQLALWSIQGTSIVASGGVGFATGSNAVVGIGDFFGNGYSDILFEDAAGNFSLWELNGTSVVASGPIGNPGAGWTFLGLGDFNGDGKSDLLVRERQRTICDLADERRVDHRRRDLGLAGRRLGLQGHRQFQRQGRQRHPVREHDDRHVRHLGHQQRRDHRRRQYRQSRRRPMRSSPSAITRRPAAATCCSATC